MTTSSTPTFCFPPPPTVSAAIAGTSSRFPVRRIFCVGRNYAEHAREMGADPTREAPFFFCKPADALREASQPVHYPSRTRDFHHEVELVVALSAGGSNLSREAAVRTVFGFGVGIDWTRRDLQNEAKKLGRPWDTGKAFDEAATLGPLYAGWVAGSAEPAAQTAGRSGELRGAIWLEVNDQRRQQGDLSELIWTVPEIIAELSTLFSLQAGDLVFTGTPAGVGPVIAGDRITAGIDGLGRITVQVVPSC